MPREPEAQLDEEILEKPPSHPIATVLLVVCAVARLGTIVLAWKQLSFYIHKSTKKDIEAKKSMENMLNEDFPPLPTAEEGAAGRPAGAGEGEGAPPPPPSPEPEPPPEGDPAAPPEGEPSGG